MSLAQEAASVAVATANLQQLACQSHVESQLTYLPQCHQPNGYLTDVISNRASPHNQELNFQHNKSISPPGWLMQPVAQSPLASLSLPGGTTPASSMTNKFDLNMSVGEYKHGFVCSTPIHEVNDMNGCATSSLSNRCETTGPAYSKVPQAPPSVSPVVPRYGPNTFEDITDEEDEEKSGTDGEGESEESSGESSTNESVQGGRCEDVREIEQMSVDMNDKIVKPASPKTVTLASPETVKLASPETVTLALPKAVTPELPVPTAVSPTLPKTLTPATEERVNSNDGIDAPSSADVPSLQPSTMPCSIRRKGMDRVLFNLIFKSERKR